MKRPQPKTPTPLRSAFPRLVNITLAAAPIIAAFLAIPSMQAATVYWDADADGSTNVLPSTGLGGTGDWNNSLSGTPLSNWWPGSGTTDQAWVNANNDTAVFAGTAGTVTITDNVTVGGLVFNTTGYTVTGGTLNFAGTTPTITSAASVSSTLNSVLTGVNGLTISTVGLTINNPDNTISGTIKVNSGSLNTNTAGSLGTSLINLNGGTFRPRANLANDVLVTANSTIDMSSVGSTFTLGTLTIGGSKTLTILCTSGVSNGNVSFGATTLTGNATILSDKSGGGTNMTSPNATFSTVTVDDSVAADTTTIFTLGAKSTAARTRLMTLHGVLSDNANDPTKILALNINPGAVTSLTVNVDAANTYTGSTTINGSSSNVTLRLTTGDDRLPTGTALIFATGGTTSQGILDLNKVNQTVGSLNNTGSGTLQGTVTNKATGSGTSTLTVSSATTDSSFAGTITDGATAKVAFTKAGAATMTLSGVNTYTGATTVSGGKLNVNGSLAAGSLVSVSNGATLGGSGLVSGTVGVTNANISDTVALGNTTFHGTSTLAGSHTATSLAIADGNTTVSGNTTVAGNFTISTGATVSMQINGSTTPGVDFDQIVVIGADSLVTLSAGSILNLSIGVTLAANTPITLIDNQSSTNIIERFAYVTIGSDTYDVSTNNIFTYNNQEFALSYTGVSGIDNDLILTVIPEPSTWAMLVGGVGMLAFGQRVRRKTS